MNKPAPCRGAEPRGTLLGMKHDCGDPDCDGEALIAPLEACTHPNGWLWDLDPDRAIGDRRFWCSGCGAVSERGGRHWKRPTWRRFLHG